MQSIWLVREQLKFNYKKSTLNVVLIYKFNQCWLDNCKSFNQFWKQDLKESNLTTFWFLK